MESMSRRLAKRSADIMDLESDKSLAVKMSIAETTMIHETKAWLKARGVNIDVFAKSSKTCVRSKTVLMVRNTPFSVT